MAPEKYAFWYEGKPWVGAPRSAASRKATCATAARSKTRAANVAYWHQWPDEYDHLIQKWDEFLNA